MENTDRQNKITVGAKIAPVVRQAVENLAMADDRSVSQMIELLLKDSPKVREEIERLEAHAAIAA